MGTRASGDTFDASDGVERYTILSPLGTGGYGSVWVAHDRLIDRRVALKQLSQVTAPNLARFKQEFRTLAELRHPNLVSLQELFERDGSWYIAMDLVDGVGFVDFARKGPGAALNDNAGRCDEGRLREALEGVVEGLSALHQFGILHRDLKPSNICVTPQGRAVLLDFGLVTSTDPLRQSTQAVALGTAAYMAPEQALGHKIGPAADWYALGVCIFEALTGQLPFDASSTLTVMLEKTQHDAPRASAIVPDVPADLDALCAQLLNREPERRPNAAAMRAALGLQPSGALAQPAPAGAPNPRGGLDVPFAGREAELELLEHALALTHEGQLRVALIEGESGVGKSELAQEFLRVEQSRHASLVSLYGRCYENERVPYKAFDGCIDELAKLLQHLTEAETRALLPRDAALLGQLFPVLRAVPAIGCASARDLPADPTVRRMQAFNALGSLLGRLAEDRPLVLVIDDLQWADQESFRLLKALRERPEPPPLLVIATTRPREELDPEMLRPMESLRQQRQTDVIQLRGLPRAHAEKLATRLLGPKAHPEAVRAVLEESHGHPLFLSELVSFAHTRDPSASSTLTLEAAFQARIGRLESEQRALLELVALAGRPWPMRAFDHALDIEDAKTAATPLLMGKLLRLRRGHELGCYHDRIRHVVVRSIPRGRLPLLHRRLAEAIALTGGVDVSEEARHWDLAGMPERAVDAYEQAAASALEALAFHRASELSARARALLPESSGERYGRLLVLQARALAAGGHSAQAADLYAQAAELQRGETRIRLRSKAANHLMLSAQTGAGLRAARDVLAELGVKLPLSEGRALLRFLWEQLRVRLFERPGSASMREAPRYRLALEVIAEIARSINLVHPIASLALTAQRVRLSLRLGDKALLAETYAIQGYVRALRGAADGGRELFARSRALCDELNDPSLNARRALSEGHALSLRWDVEPAQRCLREAHALLLAHCPDQPRELTTARSGLGAIQYLKGEYLELADNMDQWIGEAQERQDHLAVALLAGLGFGFIRHLLRDAPDAAEAEIEAAMAHVPAEPFGIAHLGYFLAMVWVRLYRDNASALTWIQEFKRIHRRQQLLRGKFGSSLISIYEVFASVQAAQSSRGAERTRQLRATRQLARRSAAHPSPWISHYAEVVLAQLDALAGDLEGARARLGPVVRGRDPYWPAAVIAEYLLGSLQGVAGAQIRERALDAYRERGFRRPERFIRVSTPFADEFAQLSSSSEPSRSLLAGRYDLLDSLGAGGFGHVVMARDLETGRRVALKELVGRSAQALERFKREFRALQSVDHPNLVRLQSLFEHAGGWYIAMEPVSGQNLVRYVREDGRCDLGRLRRAFGGLIEGVTALHEAGFVHRDINPDNVRVTSDGRAVLLDFGVIARANDEGDAGGLGNADYGAPEQLNGAVPSPALDVYALGVCLFEALTGSRPGPAGAAHVTRQMELEPPTGTERRESAELGLARQMLATEPAQRPSLATVQALLESGTGARPERRSSSLLPQGPSEDHTVFGGRSTELARLEQSLARARREGMVLALVQGESGLGKSSLVAELARRVRGQDPHVWVVRSVCYENERVSMKAFDACIDQLAHALRRLPPAKSAALLPRRSALLAELFPVLGTIPGVAKASKKGLPADPASRRLAAHRCFFELLTSVSAAVPLVFVVDDLQWADQESFRMLGQLLALRDQLPLSFVCTLRPDAEVSSDVLSELAALDATGAVERICLGGLSDVEAGELARQLMPDLTDDFVAQLVGESRGNPLFLRELVARVQEGSLSGGAPSLDRALSARIRRLEAAALDVLATIALAGKPYRSGLLARALGRAELPRQTVSDLLSQGLLRRRGEDELACYHDRIRHAALGCVDSQRTRQLARGLAAALEEVPGQEASARARLWELSGENGRALEAHEEAGTQALDALRFGQAEEHLARALQLHGETRDERWGHLVVQRGHALVRLGRSAEAAQAFLAAAEVVQGDMRTRLRIWAARHMVQAVQVQAGLEIAEEALRGLGISLEQSERRALSRIGWERVRIAARGLLPARRRRPPQANELLALEALHGLSAPVRAASYLPGSLLVMQYLRRALASGQPDHVARALAYEGLWRTMKNPDHEHAALFERSEQLAEQCGEPVVQAEVALNRGLADAFRRPRSATRHLWKAHELLQTRCPGEPWLLTATRAHLGTAFFFSGAWSELTQHTSAWMEEAEAHGDLYARAALSGLGVAGLRHMVWDAPDACLAELDEAFAPWPPNPLSTPHVSALLVRASACLYKGGDHALRFFASAEAPLREAYLFRTPSLRANVLANRARACLSALEGANAGQQAELMAQARRFTRQLRALGGPFPHHWSQVLQAMLEALEGRHEVALARVQPAHRELAAMHSWASVGARWLEGWLEGGDGGRAKRAQARDNLAQEGFRNPDAGLRYCVPVAPVLPDNG